jgi:methionine-rich copper-binding protein CopC
MAGTLRLFSLFATALLSACAAVPPNRTAAPQAQASILSSSRPANGSTVAAPVDSLELHFNPPARLDELTVTGPEDTMPMMVHGVGEVSDYSVPLSGLGPGTYTAAWKAFSGGREARGSFTFTVK